MNWILRKLHLMTFKEHKEIMLNYSTRIDDQKKRIAKLEAQHNRLVERFNKKHGRKNE